MMRNFGSSLFISLAVMTLVRSTSMNYARLTEFVTPYRETLLYPSLPTPWSLDTVSGLMQVANEVQRQAAMIGYVNAFHVMAWTATLAVPLACLLRTRPSLT
jgi:DHA2 family multidrug resistance protein